MRKKIISTIILLNFSQAATFSFNQTKLNFGKTIQYSVSSEQDTKNATHSINCYNAFSVDYLNGDNTYIPSIITQIQNKSFYLYITNKCPNTDNLKITLINKKTGKTIDNDDIKQAFSEQNIIQVQVFNSYKDVLVHFSYDKSTPTGSGSFKIGINGVSASASGNLKSEHKEENSTDDFAVRPKEFYIHINNNNTYVGHHLKTQLFALGNNNGLSTNYNSNSSDLSTSITDSNTHLNYFYNIENGEAKKYIFYFTGVSDDVKIKINEILGKEWAIVDKDDTTDDRRLINTGTSNSIKVNETSKTWFGIGTGKSENSPKHKTINSDIKSNTNKDLKFTKMTW